MTHTDVMFLGLASLSPAFSTASGAAEKPFPGLRY